MFPEKKFWRRLGLLPLSADVFMQRFSFRKISICQLRQKIINIVLQSTTNGWSERFAQIAIKNREMTATVSTSTMIKLIFKVLAKDTSLNQSHPFDVWQGWQIYTKIVKKRIKLVSLKITNSTAANLTAKLVCWVILF